MNDVDKVEVLWQEALTRTPGIEKSTFVYNMLFSEGVCPNELGCWVLAQDDLANQQTWSSGSRTYLNMVEIENRDGHKVYKCDESGPQVIVHITLETRRQGQAVDDEDWNDRIDRYYV